MSDIMNFMDLADLEKSLREDCGVAPGGRVLVGVSGGPDSLCLLDMLHQMGQPIVAAHFDHGLRPESAEDARRVAGIASRLGVPWVAARLDVAAYAAQARLSLEEAARTARYRFLFEQARANQAQAVAVAHTADDQVETVLMHLIRGAGLDGLKGMAPRAILPGWDERIPLVRPLLFAWREDTEAWCRARGLEPIWDASNQDTRFTRNRLRHELIPELASYNPQIKEAIQRSAEALAGDAEVVAAALERAWQDCALLPDGGWVALDAPRLAGQPLGLRRAVLRQAIRQLSPELRDIDFGAVERGLALLSKPGSRRAELANGLNVVRAGSRLLVGRGDPPAETGLPQAREEAVLLQVPGMVRLENGWEIAAEWMDLGEEMENQPWAVPSIQAENGSGFPMAFEAWLEGKEDSPTLLVRRPRPGERFAPLGMNGHSLKLSDFFINQKVPPRARAGWPLVWVSDQLAWVVGLRAGEACKVTPQTRRAIHLSLRRV